VADKSSSKYLVPDGMKQAAALAWRQTPAVYGGEAALNAGLEAALRWQAENPRVPTLAETEVMRRQFHCTDKPLQVYQNVAVEWQLRMYRAPEPQMPAAIKDMQGIYLLGLSSQRELDILVDQIKMEAYNRGLKDGKDK
jgi:hypothetical protein